MASSYSHGLTVCCLSSHQAPARVSQTFASRTILVVGLPRCGDVHSNKRSHHYKTISIVERIPYQKKSLFIRFTELVEIQKFVEVRCDKVGEERVKRESSMGWNYEEEIFVNIHQTISQGHSLKIELWSTDKNINSFLGEAWYFQLQIVLS